MKYLILVLTIFNFSLVANAHKFETDFVLIEHPWMNEVHKNSFNGAGYLKITNKIDKAISLIGGRADFADRIEIHEIKMENDVAKMRPLSKGLLINPGESIELKPMGIHIMFMGISQKPVEGKMMDVELVFENQPPIKVRFKVDAMKKHHEH